MSHHLDSPLARKDVRLDLTDQYLFPGETGTVLVMNVNSSLAGGTRTPGFHPEARYEFKIHFEGAVHENLTFRIAFGERDADGVQPLSLHRLTGPEARDDAATGSLLAEGRTGAPIAVEGGGLLWAGAAEDPFFLDFTMLGAVRKAVAEASTVDLEPWRSKDAANTFAASVVYSVVLELPSTDTHLTGGRSIATWSVAKLATDAGGWSTVNRAGLPMIWPIFRPDDSEEASHANMTHPAYDREYYEQTFGTLVAGVAAAQGTADALAYGHRVARLLLPDLLPYRVGTAACFGFAGFNGRRLTDNAAEVMFSLATNSAISTGLRSSAIGKVFPYVTAAEDEKQAR